MREGERERGEALYLYAATALGNREQRKARQNKKQKRAENRDRLAGGRAGKQAVHAVRVRYGQPAGRANHPVILLPLLLLLTL